MANIRDKTRCDITEMVSIRDNTGYNNSQIDNIPDKTEYDITEMASIRDKTGCKNLQIVNIEELGWNIQGCYLLYQILIYESCK